MGRVRYFQETINSLLMSRQTHCDLSKVNRLSWFIQKDFIELKYKITCMITKNQVTIIRECGHKVEQVSHSVYLAVKYQKAQKTIKSQYHPVYKFSTYRNNKSIICYEFKSAVCKESFVSCQFYLVQVPQIKRVTMTQFNVQCSTLCFSGYR